MDPSYWQIDPGPTEPPPDYDEIDDEPLAIEAPPDEGQEEFEGEEDEREGNKILDLLDLPKYDDVELRLGETDMTATNQRNYLVKSSKMLKGEEDK